MFGWMIPKKEIQKEVDKIIEETPQKLIVAFLKELSQWEFEIDPVKKTGTFRRKF